MKFSLIRQVASVVSFSALIFFGASVNAVAHADAPTDVRATFHPAQRRAPRSIPDSSGHVQRCTIDARNGAMICGEAVALQARPARVTIGR